MASRSCVFFSLRWGLGPLLCISVGCGCLEQCVTVEVMLCSCPGFVCVARPLTFNHSHHIRIPCRIWQARMVLFEKITFIYFVCSCACVCSVYMCAHVCTWVLCMCGCVCVHVWRSEGSFWELVSSYYQVGPGDPIHMAIRLCGRCFYLLSHVVSTHYS